ncbi:MAG: efflux RND transporter periplasmic adaptor subunit [Bacteroidetes bacterium]|jgi:RND family efflux transporter MFP subunit|nr:efflux RND transporter periplasmic adaptor subunit [Bacteroidota bacterium]
MKRILLIFGVLALSSAAVLGWYMLSGPRETPSSLVVSVEQGPFVVSVTTTGELQAKNSIEIKGPETARQANIWQMKISNLIAEGSVVKKGAFVAELDRSEILQKAKESELSLQKLQSQYDQATLDSTLELSQARDEMVNLGYVKEEKRIAKDQSIYEAPAMQRQAEIDYERAVRNLQQAQKNYGTKRKQSVAKIKAVAADLEKERQRWEVLTKTAAEFTIKAPADGMVIYAREWNGRKKVVGATINPWDATVATLPDLTVMESITYVNEVDIQKIAVGQAVQIRLDADPKKVLSGKVTSVANIGEQRPNADSKVFEVRINVHESDTTLRPAMTTSNTIVTSTLEQALFVPLEAVHAEGGRSFVYAVNGAGIQKKEVRLGLMNENNVVVTDGLQPTDQVYLSIPADTQTLPIDTLSNALAP